MCRGVCFRERGRGTFWRASIWVVIRLWVIKAVTIGGGKAAGIDKVLIGLNLTGCWRCRYVCGKEDQRGMVST